MVYIYLIPPKWVTTMGQTHPWYILLVISGVAQKRSHAFLGILFFLQTKPSRKWIYAFLLRQDLLVNARSLYLANSWYKNHYYYIFKQAIATHAYHFIKAPEERLSRCSVFLKKPDFISMADLVLGPFTFQFPNWSDCSSELLWSSISKTPNPIHTSPQVEYIPVLMTITPRPLGRLLVLLKMKYSIQIKRLYIFIYPSFPSTLLSNLYFLHLPFSSYLVLGSPPCLASPLPHQRALIPRTQSSMASPWAIAHNPNFMPLILVSRFLSGMWKGGLFPLR